MQETVGVGGGMGSRLEYKDGGLHFVKGGKEYADITSSKPSNTTRKKKEQVTPAKPKSTPPPSSQSQKDSSSQTKASISYRKKEFVAEGNVTVIADPYTRANTVTTLDGVGKVMSGNWYVEMVRHSWTREGYTMELEVKSNVAGGMKPNKEVRRPAVTPKKAKTKNYVVRPGDTLWAIAGKYYGNSNQWKRLWEANKSMLVARDRRNLKTPGHWIYPRQELVIP